MPLRLARSIFLFRLAFGLARSLFVLALLSPTCLYADEYPYLFRSPYFEGRGDTGIAIAEGEDAIFYNPAGVAISNSLFNRLIILSPDVEISQNAGSVADALITQKQDPTSVLSSQIGKPEHVGSSNFTGILLRRVALGFFVSQTATAMIYRDPTQGATESIQANARIDGGLVFSLADSLFYKDLYFGTTLKLIERVEAALSANAAEANQIKNINTGNLVQRGQGSGADVGVMYRRREGKVPFSAGITLQDIGNTVFTPSTPSTLPKSQQPLKNIKQTLNAGVAVEPGTRWSRFRLLLDYRDILDANGFDPYLRLHLGGELTVLDFIGLTFGLNQGYPTAGFYVDLRFVRLDLGLYTEEAGTQPGMRPDTRYFARIMVGI
jgi:hypothetical protein